ncbi:MAG: NrfD/PsrC family molybdoenzyme membrane anchor subunit [Chloroflexota bacterium]
MLLTFNGRTIDAGPRQALRFVRRDIAGMRWPTRLWLLGLMGLMAVGAVGAILAIPAGDEVFGTTPAFEWGLLIAAYVLFAVTTSGLCLVSALGTVFGIAAFQPVAKRAAVLAFICLCAAFGVIALDLHWPMRLLFGAILSPSPLSPMWWMGTVYGIYLGFLVLELAGMFGGWHRIAKLGGTLAMCAAIVAPATLGAVFGVLIARPYWHGPFMPAYLIGTAVLSGSAMLALLYALVVRLGLRGDGPEARTTLTALARLLGGAIGLGMFLVAWQFLVNVYGSVPGNSDAAMALLTGPLAPQFWLRVVAGLLVPFAIILVKRWRTPDGIAFASALVLAGLVLDRSGFVSAGQVAPTTTASGIVSKPYAAYTPSPVELAIIVGAMAAIAFAYTLAERYLDLREEPAHEHAAELAPAAAPAVEGSVA